MSALPEGRLEVAPLTPERWPDLEALFGPRGACGGCWCMWWRLPRGAFAAQAGAPNRAALRALVERGPAPGLLAYLAGRPVAWCALGPRESFPVLERSRTLRRHDDVPVWSIVCLFVARPQRRRGVSAELLRHAAGYCWAQGAPVAEGYPVVPRGRPLADAFAWTGTLAAFQRAGFVEVRGAGARVVVRASPDAEEGGRG